MSVPTPGRWSCIGPLPSLRPLTSPSGISPSDQTELKGREVRALIRASMATLVTRFRSIAAHILPKGGDSGARGTRLSAAGSVAWTHSGHRVCPIHHSGSQHPHLHDASRGAVVDGSGRRAFRLLWAPVRYDQALLLAR